MHRRFSFIHFGSLLICFLCFHTITAQHRADNWISLRTNVRFYHDTITTKYMSTPYNQCGMGIMSDENGELIIFTDGENVYNRNYEIMVGGTNIFNSEVYAAKSLIVPLPGSDSLYYLFFVDPSSPVGTNSTGLYYAIVDMSEYNGNGKVIYVSDKILDNVTGRLTAIFHENYNDIWLLTHKKSTNHYYVYLITETGISENPVISIGGKVFNSNYSGQLKVSPDGKKVVNSYDNWTGDPGEGFDTFEFNSSTGELSNPFIFKTIMRSCEGADFSSDGLRLYIFQNGSTGESVLLQYDISEYDYNKINGSRIELLYPMSNGFTDMQLATNGKIYIAKGGGQASGTKYLGVINHPNRDGLETEVEELGLYLDDGSTGLRTPNYIQSYLYKTDYTINSFCLGDTTSFQITNLFRLESVKWGFGDNQFSTEINPNHIYAEAGEYLVQLIAYYPDKTDTISHSIEILPLPVVDLGNDSTVCHGYVLDLSYHPYDFTWNDGSTLPYLIPETSGLYWVKTVDQHACIFHDSIVLDVNPTPYFSLGNDTSFCENTTYSIKPDPVYTNSSYEWSDSSTDTINYINEGGLYGLEITNTFGCHFFDNVFIAMIDAPVVDLGNDTTLSQDPQVHLILNAGYFPYGTSFEWDDNSSSRYRYIYPQMMDLGLHQVYVKVTLPEGCSTTDTINITITEASTIIENKYDISIYPNPAQNTIYINTNNHTDKQLKLFNNLGQLINTKKIEARTSVIDISILKSGIYNVVIYENESMVFRSKLVVD